MKKTFLTLLTMMLVAFFAPSSQAKTQEIMGVINMNTASIEQMVLLPDLGPAKAAEIAKLRTSRAFVNKEDLLEVKGVGEKILAKWSPYLVFDGKTTLTVKEDEN